MVTVQQVVQYYSLFFQNIVYEQVKHNDKIMTEWQYFNQLITQNPIDQNRIQTYLDIICLNKKQQQLSQKKQPIQVPSPMNLKTNGSQNNLQLKHNTEENIDTDFDDGDDSPSSNSSGDNKERQLLVFKNDDEDTDQDEQDNQQNEDGDEDEDQENVMIIERKCYDDEINNFQQIPIYTSTSPTIKRSTEKGDYKKNSQLKTNYNGLPFTPNTSKNIQQQKFSFYSNEQPLRTQESSSSPILKEVTSNFQNIKATPNYNNHSQQHGLGKQMSSISSANNNFNAYPSSFNFNQQSSSSNNENIFISQNDFSKNYNVNFKINHQKSKENIEGEPIFKQPPQQQQYSNTFSSKNIKNLTPSLSHLSITNKSLKNILQETTIHTKSIEQNLEMMEMQISTDQPYIATPQATEHGSGFKKRDISKALLNHDKSLVSSKGDNKQYLKTQPSTSPNLFNLQPPVQPVCHTSVSASSNKDTTFMELDNKEQQFQVSQNQEFESVSERKSQIKLAQNKVPFQENANQPLPIIMKPPYTPTEESKQKREFNNIFLRKQLTDVVTFIEGNHRKIEDILEKMSGNTHQQQGIYQLQSNFSVGQLGLVGGGQQYHRLGLSSNQMTPQSMLNANNPNYPHFPPQNYQQYPQVSKQASQIQLFFQPTPPPPPPHPTHQQNPQQQQQQQQQIQQLYGFQQAQAAQQQQLPQTIQQYQQRHHSQHNGVSNSGQQGLYQINFMQQNGQQQQQQQFPSMSQPQICRQNMYQPPLIPLKQTSSCNRGSSENTGGRALSTYSRESSDGQVKTMFKRMRTYDICTNTSASSQMPPSMQQKNLNRTMDENINNSNNLSCMALNTSKLNLNQPGSTNSNNVSCTLNQANNENNRYLTNSTNQLSHPNQNASQEIQPRKRSEYSFPDLKSFNKYIKK